MSGVPSIRWAAVGIALVLSILCSASDLSAESKEDRELAEIRKMIEEKGLHWTAGKTSVSGLGDEERRLRLGYNPEPEYMLDEVPQIVTLGDTIFDPCFDWRMFGCVTPVKDQRGCGTCWAFAAVAAYESHMLIYDGRYSDISEQAILSCMDFKHYSCCSGGLVIDAYKVMMEQGTVSEACMPYDASFEPLCRTDDCLVLEGSISEYGYITRSTDQEVDLNTRINLIKEALLMGPVSASMFVYYDFYYYEDGCYEPASSIFLGGHAVLVVGWDDRQCGGEGAWICKNSWGTDWGMNGYFYIKYSACDFGYRSYQLVYEPSDVLLTVQSPDGGESFVEGSEIDVTWITNREREQPDCYNVYLSMDGGGLYDIPIAEGLSNNDPITFRLPTTAGEGSILVTGMLDGEVGGMDWSDEAFTVARDVEQPFIQVLSPSGGEVVGEGYVLGIEWLATDNAGVASIDIFYSTNKANTISIAYGEENDSSYD
ncbi:MAG TPA: hypothetical protein ENO08_05735, partial [Candidatus Eisenbacteria bacterium]|nr:hypothetical protein [Candidatus Eisenbacteria bacterium]